MEYLNRITKWAKYRESIYNNIELHKEVISSNTQLSILYNRLLKVFPEYESIFSKKKKTNSQLYTSSNKVVTYDSSKIDNIIEKLNANDKIVDLKYLEKTSFSTGELDTIIDDLNSWTLKGKIISANRTPKINIAKTKKVSFND